MLRFPRRDFVLLLAGAAAAWPLRGRAQEPGSLRRIGVLNPMDKNNLVMRDWDTAFLRRFAELGWVDGRNVVVDYRWADGSPERMRALARELVAAKPSLLVAISTPATAALQAETRTIPIVFAAVSDPVGSGFVASLAKPGGNITGFIDAEGSLAGKWLEVLHEIVPSLTRVAVLFDQRTTPFARYYLDPFRSAAAALSIQPIEAGVEGFAEVQAVMDKLAHEGRAGVLVLPEVSSSDYFETVRAGADRYRLPTMFALRVFAERGGLVSYGIDYPELLRNAATYADRILKGAKPADLPVQIPTKFELVINLKTARALGLTIPPLLLTTADEVIE